MQRRDFLKQTSAAAALSCFPASLAGIERSRAGQQLERRSLGRTGERLSIIGFGGIVVMNATTTEAAERVAHAIDRGVNYFDVAPSYGNAEEMLGPALEPYRKQRLPRLQDAEARSGGRRPRSSNGRSRTLRTDHFDLYQLHAVTTRGGRRADLRARRRARGVRGGARGGQGAVPRLLGALGRGGARA